MAELFHGGNKWGVILATYYTWKPILQVPQHHTRSTRTSSGPLKVENFPCRGTTWCPLTSRRSGQHLPTQKKISWTSVTLWKQKVWPWHWFIFDGLMDVRWWLKIFSNHVWNSHDTFDTLLISVWYLLFFYYFDRFQTISLLVSQSFWPWLWKPSKFRQELVVACKEGDVHRAEVLLGQAWGCCFSMTRFWWGKILWDKVLAEWLSWGFRKFFWHIWFIHRFAFFLVEESLLHWRVGSSTLNSFEFLLPGSRFGSRRPGTAIGLKKTPGKLRCSMRGLLPPPQRIFQGLPGCSNHLQCTEPIPVMLLQDPWSDGLVRWGLGHPEQPPPCPWRWRRRCQPTTRMWRMWPVWRVLA